MKEKERMLSGGLHLPQDFQLRRDSTRTRKLLSDLISYYHRRNQNDLLSLKSYPPERGESCSVYPPFDRDYGYNICVGNNFFTNANCVILDVWFVSIGNNIMLGPGIMILPVNHPENVLLRNRGYGLGLPITIEYGVWGGAHATINPGIHIGCNRIIGAGSVVANSILANAIPAENPCKIIRAISRNIAYFRGGTLDGYTPKTKCCYSCL